MNWSRACPSPALGSLEQDKLGGVRTLDACALEDFFHFVRDVDPESLDATRGIEQGKRSGRRAFDLIAENDATNNVSKITVWLWK